MTPITFPEANTMFKAPPDLDESQCATIPAYLGVVQGGMVDGANMVVVAWKPSPEEIKAIVAGQPVFLSCLGGLPPHFLTVNFDEAIHPR